MEPGVTHSLHRSLNTMTISKIFFEVETHCFCCPVARQMRKLRLRQAKRQPEDTQMLGEALLFLHLPSDRLERAGFRGSSLPSLRVFV